MVLSVVSYLSFHVPIFIRFDISVIFKVPTQFSFPTINQTFIL